MHKYFLNLRIYLNWRLITVPYCGGLPCTDMEQPGVHVSPSSLEARAAICMSSLEKCLFSSLAHFDWVVYFSGIELQELLVYF
jgi:hypothetical protein